jgi:glucokinase
VDEVADRSILAIDLGGTQIRAAHVSPDLTVSCRRALETRDEEGVEAVIDRICAAARAVRDEARQTGLPDPVGVGISSPGPLDPWKGIVTAPPNLAGWVNIPLAARVEEAVGLPTYLERDTNAAVIGEWRYGAAKGADDVIYVTVSTGIGGGLVVDGRPLIGRDGTAGEIGHMTVDIDGPICGDGQPGHAEAIGSGRAIAREGRTLLKSGEAPGLAALAADAEVDAALVARAADEGDAACQRVLDRAWVAIGAMCASLVNAVNPEVIVLGGSIGCNRPELPSAIRAEIDRRSFPAPARRVRIEMTRFAGDVSLIGLLPIVNERMTDPSYAKEHA